MRIVSAACTGSAAQRVVTSNERIPEGAEHRRRCGFAPEKIGAGSNGW